MNSFLRVVGPDDRIVRGPRQGFLPVPDERALVAATSLETGRFVSAELSVDRDDLVALIDRLSMIEQAYVEVRLANDEFPALLVGLRRGIAVVQCMSGPESMALLAGDGSSAASEVVDVLIMDELATFTGEYVRGSARARDVVVKFVDGADLWSLGEWHDL